MGQHKCSAGSGSASAHCDFKRADIVWAKVRGYSWWPAKIGEVIKEKSDRSERKYRVDFIGDNTHQTLPHDKLADFIECYPRYSLTKKKDLLDSIETARKQLRREDQALLDRKAGRPENQKKAQEKGGNIEPKEIVIAKQDGPVMPLK